MSVENPYDVKNFQRLAKEDFAKFAACKTKEDVNKHLADRVIIVTKGQWEGERCTFVEMIGGKKKESWKMKVKTSYGTLLELNAGEVMITIQTIMATPSEAENIYQHLKSQQP